MVSSKCDDCKTYHFRLNNYLRDREIFGDSEKYARIVEGDNCKCGKVD